MFIRNDILASASLTELTGTVLTAAVLTAGLIGCDTSPIPPSEISTDANNTVTAYTGGQVFNGMGFDSRTLCTDETQIVTCPASLTSSLIKQIVDLSGHYITPPFGDAHTHHFDGPYTLDWHISLGLKSGTFYAMTMTAPTSGVEQIRDRLSGPGNIDVATSLGGLTGPESHPAEIYEALALNIRSYEDQVKRAEEIQNGERYADDAYFIVETEANVKRQMARLLENNPNHIKVFLRQSNRYEEGFGKWGPGGGIDPTLLPLIAEIARDNNKRLAVANSNIFDFRESLTIGADIVTHLPCYQDTESDPDSPYYDVDSEAECLISEHDAQQAASIGMAGTLISTEWEKDRPLKYVEWERNNIAALRKAGAPLIVATNNYGSTLTPGLIAAVEKEFFTASELLRMASMETPKIIFPDRNIGCLNAGCEASFISFEDNPLTNFGTIAKISYRLKDGKVITLNDAEARD